MEPLSDPVRRPLKGAASPADTECVSGLMDLMDLRWTLMDLPSGEVHHLELLANQGFTPLVMDLVDLAAGADGQQATALEVLPNLWTAAAGYSQLHQGPSGPSAIPKPFTRKGLV